MQIEKITINDMLGIKHLQFENLGSVVKISGKNGAGKSRALLCLRAVLQYDSLPLEKRKELLTQNGKVEIETTEDFTNPKWTFTREFDGEKTRLKVRSADGTSGNAGTIKEFIGSNFVDLNAFISLDPAKQTELVLKLVGLDDQLEDFDKKYKAMFEQRRLIGQVAQSLKPAGTMPATAAPVNTQVLADEYSAINQWEVRQNSIKETISMTQNRIQILESKLIEIQREILLEKTRIEESEESLRQLVQPPRDKETVKNEMFRANEINKIAENYARWQSENEKYISKQLEYDKLTVELKGIATQKQETIEGIFWPIEGLGYDGKQLTFNGHALMSDGQYRMLSFSIAKMLASDLSIATFENFSLLDPDSQASVLADAEKAGFQVFCEIVSNQPLPDSFYIEDGEVKE
jgi:AAA15 family ATPase/GTPase